MGGCVHVGDWAGDSLFVWCFFFPFIYMYLNMFSCSILMCSYHIILNKLDLLDVLQFMFN